MATRAVSTAKAVEKNNIEAGKNQCRPIATQVVEQLGNGKTRTHKVEVFWNLIDATAKGKKICPHAMERWNGEARRRWCSDNGAPVVFVNTIAERVNTRPENILREKLAPLALISSYAEKIGYVRVLDSNTAETEPDHLMVNAVYIFKM